MRLGRGGSPIRWLAANAAGKKMRQWTMQMLRSTGGWKEMQQSPAARQSRLAQQQLPAMQPQGQQRWPTKKAVPQR